MSRLGVLDAEFILRPALGVVCLLLGLVLTACGSVQLPGTRRAPEPVTLKVVTQQVLSFGPYFMAQEEGFFTEQGITVEFVNFQRGADAIPALAQGQLDAMGGIITFGFLNSITRGANIRIVADKGSYATDGCPAIVFVARKALVESGELKEPASLKGRRIVLNPTSSRGYNLDQLLNPVGLSIDDVQVLDLPDANVVDGMQKEQFDIAIVTEPFATRLIREANGVAWRSADALAPGLTYGIVAFGPTLLDKNPDAGQRFILAYLKGVRQYNQGKTERNLAIMAKYTSLDTDLLKQACWPTVRADGHIDIKALNGFQEWAVARKFQDALVPNDKLWDSRFVDYAKNELK